MSALARRFEPDVDALQARIDDLEAEVEYLRSELALTVDLEQLDKIRRDMLLSSQQALVVLLLYRRGGKPFGYHQLEERITRPDTSPASTILRTVVHQVRRVQGKDLILTVRGTIPGGYALSPRGIARVDKALRLERAP